MPRQLSAQLQQPRAGRSRGTAHRAGVQDHWHLDAWGGRGPQGPGSRARCSMPLSLTLSARGRPDQAAHAGTQGSCPSSAPHGPAEKSLGSVTTGGLQGTLAEQLPPQSGCGRALAVQWIRGCFCSDSGSQSPFFSFPLLPAPQCAVWIYMIAEQVGSRPQGEFTNTDTF